MKTRRVHRVWPSQLRRRLRGDQPHWASGAPLPTTPSSDFVTQRLVRKLFSTDEVFRDLGAEPFQFSGDPSEYQQQWNEYEAKPTEVLMRGLPGVQSGGRPTSRGYTNFHLASPFCLSFPVPSMAVIWANPQVGTSKVEFEGYPPVI